MSFSANSFAALAIALGVCFAAAFLGAKVTTPEIPTWYASLAKPSWTPPRIAFDRLVFRFCSALNVILATPGAGAQLKSQDEYTKCRVPFRQAPLSSLT